MRGYAPKATVQTYGKGLEGLIAGETTISSIDGTKGTLSYRGHDIASLANDRSFEEVSYLILNGHLPDSGELSAFDAELKSWREPPEGAVRALDHLPRNATPLAKYRTMLSVAACLNPDAAETDPAWQWKRPTRILAWTAAIAAAAIRHLDGKPPIPADPDLSFAANFLYQSLGQRLSEEDVRAFEASLTVQAEHGLHAAALAALIVISTGADLGSAVLAGMGALSGARHGGANQLCFRLIETLGTPEVARAFAQEKLAQKFRFPGFGHRVYKCPDPRVSILEPLTQQLLARHQKTDLYESWQAFRKEVESALSPRGIYANVDSITGLIYHAIGLPIPSFTIPFCLAIQVGWMAHCLEYLDQGPMIEPGAVYLDTQTS